jgi:hypothetical protein
VGLVARFAFMAHLARRQQLALLQLNPSALRRRQLLEVGLVDVSKPLVPQLRELHRRQRHLPTSSRALGFRRSQGIAEQLELVGASDLQQGHPLRRLAWQLQPRATGLQMRRSSGLSQPRQAEEVPASPWHKKSISQCQRHQLPRARGQQHM